MIGGTYTLKTGTPFEDGNSILKLLLGVSHPEIQLGVAIYAELNICQISPMPNTGKEVDINPGS